MPETTLEHLSRHLALEEESEALLSLPADLYSQTASYTRNLRRSFNSSNSEVTNRLIERQSQLIMGTVRRLITLRAHKALEKASVAHLLPEERYVCSIEDNFEHRLQEFIEAVSSGQSSFLELAQRNEMNRNTTIRFVRPVTEIIGVDLRRYGPFRPNDLASVPAANADILIANGEALVVYTRD